MGNAITILGGMALGFKGHWDYGLFFETLLGLSLIIASACIFNNYIDRFLDEKMARTKNRPLVTGVISISHALIFAAILGTLGLFLLAFYTNFLTVVIATLGFLIYVLLYTFLKTRTVYCTAIGSIAGGVPMIVGYCAATNRFDLCAGILFMIMVTWQMPHFFAIAIYRMHEYEAAALPVFPIKKGIPATKLRMLFYIVAFICSTLLLTLFGYTGYVYAGVAALLGLSWLFLAIKGFRAANDFPNDARWARQMFKLSLIIITTLCLMLLI